VSEHSIPDAAGLPASMVKRIDHVAIAVRSIDAALGAYRGLLGIQPSAIKTVPTEGVRIAFLPCGGPNGSEIELVEPLDPTNSIARFLEKRGEGLHHICLEVSSIDAALADLKARGALVLDDAPRPTAEGLGIFLHPKGTHGVLLELVERPTEEAGG